MDKLISKGIMAILPIYIKEAGNSTLVYTKVGIVELDLTIKTVIKNLCDYYHLDLKSSNKSYGALLSSKYRPPIPFNNDNIFIQLKTRIPIGKHDGAHGYFNMQSISKVKGMGKCTSIQLVDGTEIRGLVSLNIAKKYINNGQIVKKLMNESRNTLHKASYKPYLEHDTVATKSDIALLYMKIQEIREKLE